MYQRIKILKSLCELKFPYPSCSSFEKDLSPVWCLALLIITTMTITILITNNANYLISPNIRHDTATVVAPVELSSKFRESFYNIWRRPCYEDTMLSYGHINMASGSLDGWFA